MNKLGKSDIKFILLIPFLLLATLIVVDTLISYSENKRFKTITEEIIKGTMEDDNIEYSEYYDEIKKQYERNDYDTDMLVVEANSYSVYVENEHKYFGLLSSLRNSINEKQQVKLLGITFNLRKNSKAFVKVTAKYDYNNNLTFEYEK